MRSETRGSSFPTAIQDEELMPSERRFRDDGTKAARFYKPDDGDDRMNENDEELRNSGRFCNSPPTGRSARYQSAARGNMLGGSSLAFL
jgi:hypothetical protein